MLERQVADLENAERRAVREGATPQVEQVRRLLGVRGVGPRSAWLLVRELIGWRAGLTPKQAGSLAGLCGGRLLMRLAISFQGLCRVH